MGAVPVTTITHELPRRAEGFFESAGHDLDAECRCNPTAWPTAGGITFVHQLLAVRRCPACNRDIDRDPWPYGFPCGHCDDWSLEQAKQGHHD